MFEPENRFPLFLNMLLQERSQSRERRKLACLLKSNLTHGVILANAGIQFQPTTSAHPAHPPRWIPACAGMTAVVGRAQMDSRARGNDGVVGRHGYA